MMGPQGPIPLEGAALDGNEYTGWEVPYVPDAFLRVRRSLLRRRVLCVCARARVCVCLCVLCLRVSRRRATAICVLSAGAPQADLEKDWDICGITLTSNVPGPAFTIQAW
jgi:hypothetical protein